MSTACAGESDTRGSGERAVITTLPAGVATLLADGSVPWLPGELSSADISAYRPPPEPPRAHRRCGQADVSARLPEWFRQAQGGGIYGFVELTGTGGACRVDGVAWARVEAGGGLRLTSTAPPERQSVTLQPGLAARVRVDWTPPGCEVPDGAQAVVLGLVDVDAEVRASVANPDTPSCPGGESAEGLAAHVLVGPPERLLPPRTTTPVPARLLAAELLLPPTAPRGRPLEFSVALRNQRSEPIKLETCPVYVIELSQSAARGARGLSEISAHRLNCLAVNAVPPGATVVFRMRADIPNEAHDGPLRLAWRFTGPGVDDVADAEPRADQVTGSVEVRAR